MKDLEKIWYVVRSSNSSLTEVLIVHTFFGTKPLATASQLSLSLNTSRQVFYCGSLDYVDLIVLLQIHVLQAVIDIKTARDILSEICLKSRRCNQRPAERNRNRQLS